MKLDVNNLRYLSRDDFRVLGAVEGGMRNHDLVPTELVGAIARLAHGGAHKVLSNLLRNKLVYHERKDYDGYRLTYAGYDYLALKSMLQRGVIAGVGRQIGVGKESDIFLVVNAHGDTLALKLQRLGRTSFRTIKKNRDYLGSRRSASWMYMSRLGAMREFAFMTALHGAGFPTPTPVDNNRHALLMSLVPGVTLSSVRSGGLEPEAVPVVFATCMRLVARLAHCGLVHCDFNEFNIMIGPPDGAPAAPLTPFEVAAGVAAARSSGGGGGSVGGGGDDAGTSVAGAAPRVTMIDFPQMVSTSHPNAEELFNRDVGVLRLFFAKRFGYDSGAYPTWAAVTAPERPLAAAAAAPPSQQQQQPGSSSDAGEESTSSVEGGARAEESVSAQAPLSVPAAAAAAVTVSSAADATAAAVSGVTPEERALVRRLDLLVEASGFSQEHIAAFEELLASSRAGGAALAEHRKATGAEGREQGRGLLANKEGREGEDDEDEGGEEEEEGESDDNDGDEEGGLGDGDDAHNAGEGSGAEVPVVAAAAATDAASTGAAFVTLAPDVLTSADVDEEAAAVEALAAGDSAGRDNDADVGGDNNEGEDDDEDEDEDVEEDDDDDGDDARAAARTAAASRAASDPALAAQRPPDGVRTRPGGSRIRPKKAGKSAAAAVAAATQRRDADLAAAAGRGGGDASAAERVGADELKHRVKADLARRQRKEALSAATRGGVKNRDTAKDRVKTTVSLEVKKGDFW